MLEFVWDLRKFKFVYNSIKLIMILQLRCGILKEMMGYLMDNNHILLILLLCWKF